MDKPFQRKGSESNAHVGREFESWAQAFFATQDIALTPAIAIEIGINGKKAHKFDLGNPHERVLVECKAHTWTESGNVPVAKMTTWNEAMFFFHAAPSEYRKILFVLRDVSSKKKETLAEYYVRTNPNLIPDKVEVWEYDAALQTARQVAIPGR
jgi:hypothetical protein